MIKLFFSNYFISKSSLWFLFQLCLLIFGSLCDLSYLWLICFLNISYIVFCVLCYNSSIWSLWGLGRIIYFFQCLSLMEIVFGFTEFLTWTSIWLILTCGRTWGVNTEDVFSWEDCIYFYCEPRLFSLRPVPSPCRVQLVSSSFFASTNADFCCLTSGNVTFCEWFQFRVLVLVSRFWLLLL